jgi:hypothetical protein
MFVVFKKENRKIKRNVIVTISFEKYLTTLMFIFIAGYWLIVEISEKHFRIAICSQNK